MDKRNNPFTLDFGKEPYEMIPRSVLMDEVVQSFGGELPSKHISIITGVRGSGKTVFMTSVCKWFQKERDWIVVELNPDRDLLQSSQTQRGKETERNLQFRKDQSFSLWAGFTD